MKVALIACSKVKSNVAAPARELYQGQMFKMSVRYAEEVLRVDHWFVLSAQHGLVHPDQRLAPYEQTLISMKAPAQRAWARGVLSQIHARELNGPDTNWYILAGLRYWWFLIPSLKGNVHRPLAGLGGYGKIVSWLKSQVDGGLSGQHTHQQ